MLHVDEKRWNPVTGKTGSPLLFINSNCRGVARELELQVYAEERNPITGEKEFIGKRNEMVPDDYFDPLRYFANSRVHSVSGSRPQMRVPSYHGADLVRTAPRSQRA